MKTVLVVDDDPSIRTLLRHLLDVAGYAAIEASDGAAALDALRGPHDVDAIVLDVMMPRLDGWDVLRAVRAHGGTADLPVVMLTAKGDPRARLRGWELGCDAYVPKPFDPDDVLEELLAALVRAPAERATIRERQAAAARSMIAGAGR